MRINTVFILYLTDIYSNDCPDYGIEIYFVKISMLYLYSRKKEKKKKKFYVYGTSQLSKCDAFDNYIFAM